MKWLSITNFCEQFHTFIHTWYIFQCTLQKRHNERDGVANPRRLNCVLTRGVYQRKHESSVSLAFVRGIHRWSVDFPRKTSDAENVSIWWRHHAYLISRRSRSFVFVLKQGQVLNASAEQNLWQSNAVITRSILSRYYTRHWDDSNSTRTRLETHNKHPIARPNGRVMGCLLWVYWRKWPAL